MADTNAKKKHNGKGRKLTMSEEYDKAVNKVSGDGNPRGDNSDQIYYGFGILTGVHVSEIKKLTDQLQYEQHDHKFTEIDEIKELASSTTAASNLAEGTVVATINSDSLERTQSNNSAAEVGTGKVEGNGNTTPGHRSHSIGFLLD